MQSAHRSGGHPRTGRAERTRSRREFPDWLARRLPFRNLIPLCALVFTFGGLLTACDPPPTIGFGKSSLQGASSVNPTSLQFGPDGRLYVAQFNGNIRIYTLARSAANAYQVTATETVNAIRAIPNHDDNGALNPGVTKRLITGMLVVGSATDPVIYVSSSDPRSGGGSGGELTNLDTNSGVVSRLRRAGSTWVKLDLVRGLPRSQENHASNGLALDPASNTLYVAQGGNTNKGAPSHNFNFLPEYAYSAAILKIDLSAIGNTTYDLPTLVSERYPNLSGPFGGDFGRHQAKVVAGGPVQVFAPGFRNPYDILINRKGRMYTIDNGANAGWGASPVNKGPAGKCTNDPNDPGNTQPDTLHLITGPGYYGGHPNPTRGNRANKFNASSPQSPVPVANPVECDFRGPDANGALTTFNTATTGFTEYIASNFAGQMKRDLLVGDYYGSVLRVKLNAGGNGVTLKQTLFSNVADHPIDVVARGDGDTFPGTIWMADITSGAIRVFEPNDYGGVPPPACSGSYNRSIDEDHDGYTNADEIDNGTNPCSAADTPHDWDHDFISDRNDPDDDNDRLPDTSDPFAVDPANGLSTHVPVSYTWNNGAANPGGILNLGWTGLMTDGHSDYASLYDPTKMTAGGAAGVMTVDSVPPGDAYAGSNTQQYGFQFGLNTQPSTTGTFTVHTRVIGPFAGLTPQGNESMGLSVGAGDQDNYVKLVVTANGGSPGVQLVKEVSGVASAGAVAQVAMPGPDSVDLFLTVDPASSTVRPRFRVTTGGVAGPITDLGPIKTIPTAWLASTTQGLAVGVISTSSGGTPFSATWDLIEAVPGNPT